MPATTQRVLSIIPPMTQLNTPYPSTAYITGFLRSRGIAATQADIALGWRRILSTVRDYRDLEPALLGRVEELIDFVTAPGVE